MTDERRPVGPPHIDPAGWPPHLTRSPQLIIEWVGDEPPHASLKAGDTWNGLTWDGNTWVEPKPHDPDEDGEWPCGTI